MADARENDAVNRFLVAFLTDRDAGSVRSLADYQRRFPGHDGAIAREHALLLAGAGAPAADGAAPEDERIGPYRLMREIGRGGQGTVWQAEDTRVGRTVALKVLPRGGEWSRETRARFRREAEIAARLEHPGICTVYEADFDSGRPYVAMRLVEGETLRQRIQRARRGAAEADALGLADAARLVEKAAWALAEAHAAGVVHRDIKPGNLMITPDGEVVVLDFGLARDGDSGGALTLTGDVFGTPAYMAPEQVEGLRVDARADVWALAVMVYEAIALAPPFAAPTRATLYRAILSQEPLPLRHRGRDVPADLRVIVATGMSKDLSRRYATARELAQDLEAWRLGRPITARPITTFGRLARWSRREPRAALVVAALIVSLLGAAGMAGYLLAQRTRLDAGDSALAEQERLDLVRDVSSGSFRPGTIERLREVLHEDPRLSGQRASLAAHIGGTLGRIDEAMALLDAAPADEQNPRATARVRVYLLRRAGLDAEAKALEDELGRPRNALDAFYASYAHAVEAGAPDAVQRRHDAMRLCILYAPKNEAHLERYVSTAKRLGLHDEAERAAWVLETKWPESAEAWLYSALAMHDRDPARAHRASLRAIELGKEVNAGFLVAIHGLEMDLGQFDRAAETFARAMAIAPDEERVALLMRRARACHKHDRRDEARAVAARVLELEPDHAEAREIVDG